MAKNVKMTKQGTKLVLEVDLSKEFGSSKSGNSIIIASTEGNAVVEGSEGVMVGLNVYRKSNGK